jgi:hypothetical protein
VNFELVRQFVVDAEDANLFTESVNFEAKERRDGNNVAEAVAALSNTDGGVVLVGVRDRGASGEDRIIGVEQRHHDSLVANLQSLMPTAMPEVIPVRIPPSERLIIVLRVDADAVLHPVMVAGKVLYRVPGHSVPADRQRVMDMLARDAGPGPTASAPGRMSVMHYAFQPAHIDMWPQAEQRPANTGELRVVGGLTLPGRIADRPWIDSRGRRAARDVLNSSPLRSARDWSFQVWETAEARASIVRLYARPTEGSPVDVDGSAYVNLTRRSLSIVLAFRWSVFDRGALKPLRLEAFYWALIGSLVTVASTCRHVAAALDAADPSEIRPFEAYLTAASGRAFDAVDISPFRRDNRDKPERANFPSARPTTTELAELDQLARNWLTYWLLEVGTRDFEGWLAEQEIPPWLIYPTVGLPLVDPRLRGR